MGQRFTKHGSLITNCAACGKEIIKQPSQAKRSKTGNHFCSRSCSAKKNNGNRSLGENHNRYTTGEWSYRKVAFRYYDPVCECCGYDKIDCLDVHHIDHNVKNNKVWNLAILCPNCHREVHRGHRKLKKRERPETPPNLEKKKMIVGETGTTPHSL